MNPPTVTCTVTSSEPQDGPGKKKSPDIVWQNGQLLLRAERSGGSTRTYTIACTARDASMNASTVSTTVVVPLSAP